MRELSRKVVCAVILTTALIGVGCAGAASPSAPPAEPGTATPRGTATAAPPMASDAASAVPSEQTGTLNIAYPSGADFPDLPSLIALDALRDRGYTVEVTNFDGTELAIEALSRGEVQVADTATAALIAIQAGAPIKLLVEQAANEWSIVVTNDIQTCADLDGKRLAIHSEGSISGAMVRAYIASECPEAEPEFLIVPGSENRAAALLAGEIDATPAELADKVILVGENPDRFRVLANFAEDLPNLITSVYSTNTELGEDDQAIVRAFLRELLTVHRNVASDPSILGAAAVEYLDSDPAEAATAAEAYLAIDAFALDGGLDPDSVQYTLEFLEGAEQLEPGLTPQDAAAFDILESVLADMGNP